MQGKLQELTEKVYQEGISKAKEDSEKILSEAKQQAEKILAEARKEAEATRQNAEKQSEEQRRNVESEIRLASRQMIAALKQQVTDLVTAKMIDDPLDDSFNDVEFMKKLLETVVANWKSDASSDLTLLLSNEWQKKLDDYLKSKALQALKKGLEIKTASNIKGFSIGPADGSFRFNFSEEGFSGFLKEYLKPKAARFLFEEE
jgi:V/A-type H+/Na+-transporting ATPase subunit E